MFVRNEDYNKFLTFIRTPIEFPRSNWFNLDMLDDCGNTVSFALYARMNAFPGFPTRFVIANISTETPGSGQYKKLIWWLIQNVSTQHIFVECIVNDRLKDWHRRNGFTFIDEQTCYIDVGLALDETNQKYRIAREKQLRQWLLGNPTHITGTKVSYLIDDTDNTVRGKTVYPYSECCPDFSCCAKPMWDVEKRRAYMEADEFERNSMFQVQCLRKLL